MASSSAVARLVFLLHISAALVWCQSYTASVRGQVNDASGGSVPGARVVITEADRGVEHATFSDNQGRFVVTALPPGSYTLTVEAVGFKKHARGAFPLVVQEQATINVELQIGDIASEVKVEESTPLLNTTISNLGQVIEN